MIAGLLPVLIPFSVIASFLFVLLLITSGALTYIGAFPIGCKADRLLGFAVTFSGVCAYLGWASFATLATLRYLAGVIA